MGKPAFRTRINPREVALECLMDIEKGGIIQEIVDSRLKKTFIDIADRKLVADLVYGYLRNFLRLDFMLRILLPHPEKMPVKLLKLLGLGLYSMFFQDKSPDYAIVDESVKIAIWLFGQKMGNLANAVLRAARKLGNAPLQLEWYAEKLPCWKAQCVFYGIPEALATLWRDAYGEENAVRLMRRSSNRPWTGLRFNAARREARELCSGIAPAEGREKLGSWAWAFAPGHVPDEVAGHSIQSLENRGLISRQSPVSILIGEKLGLYEWKEPVWDCCAGSGIKLAALLERGVSLKLASDVSAKRLANIRPFCERLELGLPVLALASAEKPPLKSWHGHILADVPCSGIGTLPRRPDIRLNFLKSLRSLKNHVEQQRRILNALGNTLAAGRRLAYLTCALNPDENERQIRWFLREFPAFTLLSEWQTPHDHPWLEGMYGAVLEKR